MQPEMAENLPDMLLMEVHIFGIDKDVVKVDNDRDVQHINEDCIDKSLESSWGVGQAEGHY